YTSDDDQIPFLLEMATVYFDEPSFPTGANFITSPLTFGDRMARYLLAAIAWGRTEHGIGVMPICGGNAPMTIAGNVVVSAAELLGAWLTVKSVQPDATFRGGACNGIIDMRRGVASFGAPEALLADLGVCELFERRLGGRVHMAGGSDYIDARLTGLQSAYERTMVAMGVAAFTDQPFNLAASGTLDSGKVFSPVDFIVDRELGAGLWRLGRGIEVTGETMALDTIEAVGVGEGRSYMETDHTLRHYRETWFPKMLARGMWASDDAEFGHEENMKEAAFQHYLECLSRYTPPELSEAKLAEIKRIVERARRAVLT
ncbi:MAG: trimethylamine methyltransferase family protein, partial [Anaerolineae bacterium]|nr:trimethylamine methyltransferase family protein [Anaerolineae bacterium]